MRINLWTAPDHLDPPHPDHVLPFIRKGAGGRQPVGDGGPTMSSSRLPAPSARSKVNPRLGGSRGTGSSPDSGPAESKRFTHGRSVTKDGNAKEGVPWVHHSSRGRYSSALWLLCVEARALKLGKGQAVCSYADSKANGGRGHSPQRLPRGRCRNNKE